jgi:hypothetical protein
MSQIVWLERQYRALLVREGELLEGMLALSHIERSEGQLYTALKDELIGIGRHQSEIAGLLRMERRRGDTRVRSQSSGVEAFRLGTHPDLGGVPSIRV